MACLLGIEAGTTKVKAALVDDEKGLLACAAVDCAVPCARDGRAEIDMERYWRACCRCFAVIARKSAADFRRTEALAVASQGVTFVPVDRRGLALGKGIALYDTRAAREAEDLVHRFGEAELYRITGQPKISAIYEGAKLLWLRRHDPRRFRRIHKILLVHDYLVYKLTGKYAAVPSLLSSSLLFNVKSKRWWEPMLDYLGLSPDRLPEICDHGQPVATVCPKASRETGLSEKTLVVAGALDQICGMTGMGNIAPGLISESTGTVLAVHTLSDDFFPRRDSGILNFRHFRDGRYALIGVCPTACSALDWFVENFAGEEKAVAQKAKKDVLELLSRKAAKVPPGSEGVIMLPHLAGSGSPRPNPAARGLFWGFRLHHKKEHFIRALMEAIACGLRANIEVFRHNGFRINEVRSFGGGARSRLWNQIKADICGLPVITSKCPEPGCLGAAILAGVGCGLFRHPEAGCRRLVTLHQPQQPDAKTVKQYESLYQEYMALEKTMAPMFNRE